MKNFFEKETMRYLRVMWNSRQRHERWRLWLGVICNCMYGNVEDNGVIDNVESVRVLCYPISVSLVINKSI